MSERNNVSRRSFVERLAAGFAFTIVPAHVLGRRHMAPSDRVNVACIGAGGMGGGDVRGVAETDNVYALCDVDLEGRGAETVNLHPKAKRYADYREMIEKELKNIDAVMVSTPDHSHAAAVMLALKAGKHVRCQKPLTRTTHEARVIAAEAARRPKQITQMGNQGHAASGLRQIREWVEAGAIGPVRAIEFWTGRPVWPQAMHRPTEAHNAPPTLNWDLWLGPAPFRPYHPTYAPHDWRGWYDFGAGPLGDMGCHVMDAAYWGLDLRYPSRVIAESTALFPESFPQASRIVYEFPARNGRPAVTLTWRDGGSASWRGGMNMVPPRPFDWPAATPWPFSGRGAGSGQLWIGDAGTLVAGEYAENPKLSDPKKHAELMANPPAEKYPRVKGDVYAEWLDGIRSGTQPGSNFAEYAARFTEVVMLGNVALRLGAAIHVDPETGRITHPTVPVELVNPPYRKGWSL